MHATIKASAFLSKLKSAGWYPSLPITLYAEVIPESQKAAIFIAIIAISLLSLLTGVVSSTCCLDR